MDRQSFNHSNRLGAPCGEGWGSSGKCYRMIQHRKKYISNPALGHLSSSPLLALVLPLMGWHVFMCRLSERRPLRLILAFYYQHLFNRAAWLKICSLGESITGRDETKRKLESEWPRDRVKPRVLPPTCTPDSALVILSIQHLHVLMIVFFIHVSRWNS